jgi:phage terminase small subunit
MKETEVLTQRERKFVLEYFKNDCNHVAAATAAGYKNADKHAYKIIQRPMIQAAIAKVNKKVMTSTSRMDLAMEMTLDWKKKKLKLAIERAIPDEQSEETQIYDPHVGLKAIAELNKIDGDYAPEKHHNVNLNADVDMAILKEHFKLLKQHEKEY